MKRLIPIIILCLLILASCAESDLSAEIVEEAESASAVPDLEAVIEVTPEASPSSEIPSELSVGEQIIQEALAFEGYKYVYGGKSPERGFDCSGLIYYLYKQHGYLLYRVAEDQATQGEKVESLDDLMPGDILCFKKGNYCGHVGLYMGDGKFIHATDATGCVTVTDLADYAERYAVDARRIIGNMEVKTKEQIEKEEEENDLLIAEALKAKAALATSTPMPTPEIEITPDPMSSGIYIIPTPLPSENPPVEEQEDEPSSESSDIQDDNTQNEEPASSATESSIPDTGTDIAEDPAPSQDLTGGDS